MTCNDCSQSPATIQRPRPARLRRRHECPPGSSSPFPSEMVGQCKPPLCPRQAEPSLNEYQQMAFGHFADATPANPAVFSL
ncbi:hypothetical protein ACPA9J_11430 [Pseudomonas aeruginosa]